MEKRSKKRKIILSSILWGLLMAVLNYYPLFSDQFISLALITTVEIFLVYWILDFDLKINEIFHFIFPPILITWVTWSIIDNLGFYGAWPLVVVSGFMAVVNYILLSSLNIINVSTVRPVPLRKVALSTLFFVGMLLIFTLGMILIQTGWGINRQVFTFGVAIALFGVNFLFLGADDGRAQWVEMLFFAYTSIKLSVLINFWPSSRFASMLALVGWLFILMGILHYHINKNLKISIIREYLMISLILLVVYLWF